MGRERLFRGGREGRDRPFDWYTLAKERDVSLEQARVLYEEALRRAREFQGPHRNAEALYLELLEEARQEAWRPSPGKVTRTMLLQAERTGKKPRRSHISPRTGRPIAPGKRTLTSYLEPPAEERRTAERQRLEAMSEEYRALRLPMPPSLQRAWEDRIPEDQRRDMHAATLRRGALDEDPARTQGDAPRSPDTTLRAAAEQHAPGMEASRRLEARLAMIFGGYPESEEFDDAAGEHAGDDPSARHTDAVDPREPLALFAQDARGPAYQVPYREDMERLFGTFFGNVRAYLGHTAPLAAFGAQAAAWGEQVAFASPHPNRAQVAHELAHVVQARRAGHPDVSQALSAPDDAAEREAGAVAARVARYGTGGRPVALSAQPRAAVHFDRGDAPHLEDGEQAENRPDLAALLGQSLVQADAERTERPTDDPAPPGKPAEEPGMADGEQASGEPPAGERKAALPEGELSSAPPASVPAAAPAPGPAATAGGPMARGTGPQPMLTAPATAESAGPAVTPGAAPAAVAQATAGLLRLGETEKSMVQQSAAAQVASVEQAGAQQKAAVQQAAATLRAEVAGSFAALRADIEAQAQAAREAVAAARDTEKARVQEAEAAQIARIRDGVTERRERMRVLGETLAQDAVAHGRAEAQRALTATKAKATQAQAIGEEQAARFQSYDKAEEIGKTARTMAKETAKEILNQGAKVALQALKDGRALAEKLRQDAQKHAANFEIDADAIEGIRQASHKAQESLDKAHDDTIAQIDEAAALALAGVDEGEQAALAQLDGIDAQMLPAIDAAVASACAGIEQAARESAAQLDSALAQVAAAAGSVDESRAAAAQVALQALAPGVQSLGRGIRSALVMLGARSVNGLVQAGTEAAAGVAASGQPILEQNAQIQSAFATQMAQVSAAARDGMGQSAGQAVAKMAEVGDAVTAELDKAFAEGRESLTTTATEGKAEITGKVDQCVARMDQSLADLVPAIVQQADDIEHASWWDKLASAVAGFFKGFFGQLWEFIKDLLMVLAIVAAVLIILVVLAVVLVTLFPALLGPLLAGLLFLAVYGPLMLTVIGYLGLAIGVAMFALSVYRTWQAWNDPTLTWEQKWEATGRTAFDVVDVIGPEKFLKWLKPITRRLKSLTKGTDTAPNGMTDAARLDNAGDLARVDEAGDLAKLDNVDDAAKLDNAGDAAKLDDAAGAGKAEDIGDATKLDDTSATSAAGKSDEALGGKGKIPPAPITLTGPGDKLGDAIKWLKPEPGKIDVVVHGSADSFWMLRDGHWVSIDHRSLAKFIQKSGGQGQDIRLVSCGTGGSPSAVAQHLANKLGVRVTAPSDTLWIHPNGKLTIGKNPAANTGQWNTFGPGNEMEVAGDLMTTVGKSGDGATDVRKADDATRIERAQGEQDAISIGKDASPKLGDDGRYEVKSRDDVDALRAHKPQQPAGLNPADQKLWDEYLQYWDKRLGELERQLKRDNGPKSNPPCTFEKYKEARGKYDDLALSKEFQKEFSRYYEEKHRITPDIDIGMKKGDDTTKYADVVGLRDNALDVYSVKQRDYTDAAAGGSDARKKVLAQVREDVSEALRKYAGEVEIRRKEHTLYAQKVTIREMSLVYDSRLVPKVPKSLRVDILKEAKAQAKKISEEIGTAVSLNVIFYPDS